MSRAASLIGTRVAAAVVALVGLTLIVLPVASNSFNHADQAQHLLDGARPIVARPHLQEEFQAGLDSVRRTQQLLTGPAFGQIASALGETPAQFQLTVRDRWPAVARGAAQAAAIGATTQKILANLERHQRDFERADSIPVSGLAVVSSLWAQVTFGALLLVMGFWLMFRAGLLPALAVAALGLVFVVAGLAIGLPSKTASAHRIIATLNLSPPKNAALQGDLATVEDSFHQLQTELFPQVAEQLGISGPALRSRLEASAPGLNAGLGQAPTVIEHFRQAVQFRIDNTTNFPPVRDYPFQTLMWVSISLGGLAAIGGAAAAIASRTVHRSA